MIGIGAAAIATASYGLLQSGLDKAIPLEDERITMNLAIPIQPPAPEADKPDRAEPEAKTQPAIMAEETIEAAAEHWLSHQIKPGENLSLIFSKHGLSHKTLHEILTTGEKKTLSALYPGRIIRFMLAEDGRLEKLVYERNLTEALEISRSESGFKIRQIAKDIEPRIDQASGKIQSSLFLDAKKAGLTDKLIMQLANIFGWDIDFALDLRENDQFTVLYEKLFLQGEEIGTGDILAAEFINQGKAYQALRYTDKKGHSDYYTPDGKSVRRAFLRTPVEFARISSYFNLRRKHPILNTIRAHKGVDYAAPTGTPVRSTGKGKIIYRGRKGGYGNAVVVQHGSRYSTLYAHLSRFSGKYRLGSRVRQGAIIGYVGKTGLATGPHLHYEFRVNGVHRNPLTVLLPGAEPIKRSLMAEFKRQTAPLLAQLERYKDVVLAQTLD